MNIIPFNSVVSVSPIVNPGQVVDGMDCDVPVVSSLPGSIPLPPVTLPKLLPLLGSESMPHPDFVPKLAQVVENWKFNASDQILKNLGLMYLKGELKSEYADAPPGRRDNLLLFEQQAPYFKVQFSDEWFKKKIVVSYPAIGPKYTLIYEGFLSFLFGLGFEIWIYTGENLKKISHQVDLVNVLKTTQMASLKEIVEICARYRIGKDEQYWIDYRNARPLFEQLLEQKEDCFEDNWAFNISTFPALCYHAEFKKTFDNPKKFVFFVGYDDKKDKVLEHLPPNTHLHFSDCLPGQFKDFFELVPPNILTGLTLIQSGPDPLFFSSLEKALREQNELKTLEVSVDDRNIKQNDLLFLTNRKQKLHELKITLKYCELKDLLLILIASLDPTCGHLILSFSEEDEEDGISGESEAAHFILELCKEIPRVDCYFHNLGSFKIDNNRKTIDLEEISNDGLSFFLQHTVLSIYRLHIKKLGVDFKNVSIPLDQFHQFSVDRLNLQPLLQIDSDCIRISQILSQPSIKRIETKFDFMLENNGDFYNRLQNNLAHSADLTLVDPGHKEAIIAKAREKIILYWKYKSECFKGAVISCSAPFVAICDYLHLEVNLYLDPAVKKLYVDGEMPRLTGCVSLQDFAVNIRGSHTDERLDGLKRELGSFAESLTSLTLDQDHFNNELVVKGYENFFQDLARFTFPNLKKLILKNFAFGPFKDFIHFLTRCPQLETLECKGVRLKNVKREEIGAVTLPCLSLVFNYVTEINGEEPIESLLSLMPNLLHLEVDKPIPFPVLRTLAVPFLRSAVIPHLSNKAIHSLLKQCPGLLTLETSFCKLDPILQRGKCQIFVKEFDKKTLEANERGFAFDDGAVKNFYVEKKIFSEAHPPSTYRTKIYNVVWSQGKLIQIPCTVCPQPIKPPGLSPPKAQKGSITVELTPEWEALTGLSPADILWAVNGVGFFCPPIETGYDSALNQWFIRSKGSTTSIETIEYWIVKKENNWLFSEEITFNPQGNFSFKFLDEWGSLDYFPSYWHTPNYLPCLKQLVAFFRSFSRGSAGEKSEDPFFQQMNTILEKKTGIACEGRAQLFCFVAPLLIQQISRARLIGNQSHAFVEVKIGENWWNIDLGGYDAEIQTVPSVLRDPLTETLADLSFTEAQNPQPLGALSKNLEGVCEIQDSNTFAQGILSRLNNQPPGKRQALFLIEPHELELLHHAFLNQNPKNFGYLSIKRKVLWTNDIHDSQVIQVRNACQKILQKGGIIFLDLSELSSSNIATLCHLTDPSGRTLSGFAVHDEVIIIACLPKQAPLSSDIGRRFAIICPLPALSGFKETSFDSPSYNALSVDLHRSPVAWKRKLVSFFDSEGRMQPGAVLQAVEAGCPLLIKNPPDDLGFKLFLQHLRAGFIEYKGDLIPAPVSIIIEKCAPVFHSITITKGVQKADFVLNGALLADFLPSFTFSGNQMAPSEGILKAHRDQKISILVMHPLQDYQWMSFFEAARQNNVEIHLIVPPYVSLPLFLIPKEFIDHIPTESHSLILCDDIIHAVNELKKSYPDAIDLPVSSSTTVGDIIPTLMSQEETAFGFTYMEGEIWRKLKAGKTVILHGHLSDQVLAEVAGLFGCREPHVYVNGSRFSFEGKLFFITPQNQAHNQIFERMPTQTILSPACNEEWNLERHLLIKATLTPTRRSCANLRQYRAHGVKNPLDTFKITLDHPVLYSERFERVQEIWQVTPFIYIFGPPASGKTHFIFEVLPAKMKDYTFYFSYSHLQAFLRDPNPSVLCLDEGDLSPEKIESLYGLLLKESKCLLEGNVYLPKVNKRVVITGNAKFANRHNLSFIKEHGGALYFSELLLPAIRDILKNLIPTSLFNGQFLTELLHLYSQAKEEKLEIDLRHLKMMCAIYTVFAEVGRCKTAADYAQQVFFEICPQLSSLQTKKEHFEQISLQWVKEWISGKVSDYYFTESRLLILSKLLLLLQMRDKKIEGYQRGLLLEGPAGEGKTTLVQALLQQLEPKRIVRISLTDEPAIVRQKLYMAFHDGTIVVIDEFDGKFETECNAYLTGLDLDRKQAAHPGFFLIGTTNGVDYSYRLPRSPALDSRLQIIQVPAYTDQELETILSAKGLAPDTIQTLIMNHRMEQRTACHEALKPTSADLFQKATQLTTASLDADESQLNGAHKRLSPPAHPPAKRR